MGNKKFSQFNVGTSPAGADEVVGLQAGDNARWTFTSMLSFFQAADPTLAALAGVTTAANKMIYATGADTFSTTDITAQARTFMAAASQADQRSAIGLGSTDDVMFDDLIVSGNLTVNGTLTTIDTDNYVVEDSLIKLARSNVANSLDIGVYGQYQPAATPLFGGFFRDASDGKWKFFDSLQVDPTTTVDTGGTGYAASSVVVGTIEAGGGTVGLPSFALPTAGSGCGLYGPANDQPAMVTGGVERWRQVGSSMIHGYTASISVGNSLPLQFHATGATGMSLVRWSATGSAAPEMNFAHAESGTIGTLAASVTASRSGTIGWYGVGTDTLGFNISAAIRGFYEGTIGAGSIVPGRLDFLTTNAAGTLTQALRINSGQRSIFGTSATDNGTDTVQVNGTLAASGKAKLTTSDVLVSAHNTMGATETFDAAVSDVHTGTLDANCTFTLSNPSATGRRTTLELHITQNGTGGWTIAWPASCFGEGGGAVPAGSIAANATDVWVLTTVDGGTTWRVALAIKGS